MITTIKSVFCVGLVVLGMHWSMASAEIPEGTVLSAANLAQLEDQTFDGHRLGDLITEHYKMWIEKYGLTLKLKKAVPVAIPPQYAEYTAKYASEVRFNPDTKKVENFTAGFPFPNIDVDDPYAGYKAIWNNYYANPVIGDVWIAQLDHPDSKGIIQTSAKDGLIRNVAGGNYKFLMEGRVSGGPHRLGNGTIHKKALLGLTSPYDVAGLGLYQVQYNDGREDDVWAYVKAVRRIRRLSGALAWTDSQPGLDLLNDDNQGIDGYPLWYKDFKMLGKRWILAVVHGPSLNTDTRVMAERIDLSTPPYWNPINIEWEPREVYVIDATTPDYHPYSKKVLYMDTQFPTNHRMEAYDKKGDLWRIWQQAYCDCKTTQGYPSVGYVHSLTVDFKFQRATFIPLMQGKIYVNPEGVEEEDFRPEGLAGMASGRWPFDIKNEGKQ